VDGTRRRLKRARQLSDAVNGHPEEVEVVLPQLLERLADEADPVVIAQLITGLGWAGEPGLVADLARFATHPHDDVRLAIACAGLPGGADVTPALLDRIDLLVALSADTNADVRDFSCFSLGYFLREQDHAGAREALAARLADPHDDTRCEALLGLAHRKDPRALSAVIEALGRGDIFLLEIEAVAALGDPALHPLLDGHVDGWETVSAARTAEVAWRLTDPGGVGTDLVAGVAHAVAAHALGPDDEWWQLLLAIDHLAPDRTDAIVRDIDVALAGDAAGRVALRATWMGQDLPPLPAGETPGGPIDGSARLQA
jgi:hypothetical protein